MKINFDNVNYKTIKGYSTKFNIFDLPLVTLVIGNEELKTQLLAHITIKAQIHKDFVLNVSKNFNSLYPLTNAIMLDEDISLVSEIRNGIMIIDEIDYNFHFDSFTMWENIFTYAKTNNVRIVASTRDNNFIESFIKIADDKKDISSMVLKFRDEPSLEEIFEQ